MKEYYSARFFWIFNYTRKDVGYCILKTLCIILGLPIYAVSFVVEILFTFINMLFGWIPIVGILITTICKAVVWLFSMTFYITILTDLKAYKAVDTIQYEFVDEADTATTDDNADNQQ